MKTIKLVTEGIYLMGYIEKNESCCYHPLAKEAKELDLPLLPPFEEEIDIEDLAFQSSINYYGSGNMYYKNGFINGYKAAQSKQQEAINFLTTLKDSIESFEYSVNQNSYLDEKIDEFIQSLSTQQLPKEFIPIMKCGRCYKPDDNEEDCWSAKECSRNNGDYKDFFKTIINSEGKEEIQGKYEY